MTEQPTEKTCTKCGETKPLEEFHRNKRRKDGRYPYCKLCKSADDRAYREANRDRIAVRKGAYYAENKERINAANSRWNRENRDKVRAHKAAKYQENIAEEREKRRAYREENREALRVYYRERYWADPDAARAQSKDWYVRNRAYALDKARKWAEANPEAVRAIKWRSSYLSRMDQLGLEPVTEDFTVRDVIARYGDRCAYCETGEFEELDHYIPVKAGGPHTLENARPACSACNRAKWDADPEEWLAEQAEFDALTEDEQNALIDAEIARWLPDDEGAR